MDQVMGRWLRKSATLLFLCLCPATPFDCKAEEPTEYGVKAAFLLNFTKFIEWPPSAFARPDSPISICILGTDPFGNVLDQIVSGEEVNGRKVTAQRITQAPPPQTCQVVFATRWPKGSLQILHSLGSGVLTVGEGDEFIHEGGMIAFTVEDRRVRFSVNQAAAVSAGLEVSSKMLSVARSVER